MATSVLTNFGMKDPKQPPLPRLGTINLIVNACSQKFNASSRHSEIWCQKNLVLSKTVAHFVAAIA